MRRARLLFPSEIAAIVLCVLAGILVLAGRRLYGDRARSALFEQVRALPGHADPLVLALLLVTAIMGGGFVLCRFRQAAPVVFGAAAIVFAGVAGCGAALSFGRRVLLEGDGAVADMAVLAAFTVLCVAVAIAAWGWDTLLQGCAARRRAWPVPPEPGRPFSGLLTPGTMARTAAQLALQLANYAAAEAARQEMEALAASAHATAEAGTAARSAETARADAKDWAAARMAQANASLAVRKAVQG